MDRCDFKFRGELLSSHGYMLCEFDGSSSTSVVTTDSQREFTSVPMFMGKYHPILYYTYNNALIMEMSICKIDDVHGGVITPTEASSLKRWLSSPVSQEFRVGGDEYEKLFLERNFQY